MISTPQYRAYMINDIRAAMYSQIPIYPKGSSICVIVIGTGIGMSVVLNGHFLYGANGYVGEWGFCPLRLEDGTVTTYDQVITGKAIVETTGLDPDEIIAKFINRKSPTEFEKVKSSVKLPKRDLLEEQEAIANLRKYHMALQNVQISEDMRKFFINRQKP